MQKLFKFLTLSIASLSLVLLSAPLAVVHGVAAAPCENGGTGVDNCFTPATVHSANNDQPLTLSSGFGFSTLGQAINTIISVIFFVAALAAFFYILLGAFTYVTAGDDATKTEKARKSITNAVVGLILVALVYVIWLIVINTVPGIKSFFA